LNKKKIFNDPVYGFVTIPCDLVFDIIEHPYFQRLRRIRQLGMTDFVYPGALHTRFHHAIGAMHLMGIALQTLQGKGHDISTQECEAAQIAILLHDIGHGPFSHALENSIMHGIHHEKLSVMIMHQLNKEFNGALDLAIKIFTNTYERTFFHQLVSSQLDTDRIDYLKRDSFFTGVSEGSIGASRILRMLEIRDNKLVVEEKGIYSIENFLNARRLMYWQVYLHKTTVSAEQMLIQTIRRARYLSQQGEKLSTCEPLCLFLQNQVNLTDFQNDPLYLKSFIRLDDHDIMAAVKAWTSHPDKVLSFLSNNLINRKLFRIQLSTSKFEADYVKALKQKVVKEYGLSNNEADYLFLNGHISNAAYILSGQTINILTKRGEVIDVAKASDLPNIKAMSKIVKKYYLCWPKNISL
jgi:HD superfamily phosphohydrolase